ncbi:hypothetical protein DC081_09125 [Ignatzschineria cameli]|uniref:hypothetical protein n=1 Tax=Ignatzschineria cameli TaxID=2182793 RepID=UPI000D60A066|nr:hypothetical protein [Ignatzschineria cameli]PWD89601.1 hypothetical protein DC081_09125 [Ignatzschineria cameli]
MMTNNEMKASIVVDLDDKKVKSGTRDITRNVDSMSQRLIRNTNRVNAQYKNLTASLKNQGGAMISYAKNIAAAYGSIQTVKMVWKYNDGLRDLQRRTNLSNEEMERYKQLLFDIQMQYGVNKQAFSQYIDEVARGIQTYEELEDKARQGAIAMAGLGMSGSEAADFEWMVTENNVQNPQRLIDQAANIGQNKNGRFSGRELLSGAYEVMQDWKGPKSADAVSDIMTFLQMQSKDTQSISEAVDNFKSFVNDLKEERKFISDRLGLDVFNKDDDALTLKSLQPIIDLIAKDTKEGQQFKGLWYDQEGTLTGRLSPGGAKTVMSLANKEENFESIRNSEGVNVERVALDRSRNFEESMTKLMSVLERFADMNLAAPIDELSKAIADLDPEQVQEFLNVAKELVKWAGGAYVAYKGMKMAGGAIETAKTVFGNAAEVHKVFVTNMKEAREGRGFMKPSNMNKHLGALGILENIQYAADQLSQDKDGAKILREEYGDEQINKWMDEQGYSSFMRNLDALFFDDVKEIVAKGALTEIYGADKVKEVYQDQLAWYEAALDLKSVSSEDLSKIIQENAAYFMDKDVTQEVEGHVNVDSNVVISVQAAAGVVAEVQRQDTKAESTLKSKLGYTGGRRDRGASGSW